MSFTQEGMRAVLAGTVSDSMRADEFMDSDSLDALAAAAWKYAEQYAEEEYDTGRERGLDACAWTHE